MTISVTDRHLRLTYTIISIILEEAAIIAVVLWGLPRIDIHLHLAVLIAIMLACVVFSVFIYRVGTRALMRKPMVGLPGMVGSRGKVVSRLAPTGVVKINTELWEAKSAAGRIRAGEDITVVGQEALVLVVRRTGSLKDAE